MLNGHSKACLTASSLPPLSNSYAPCMAVKFLSLRASKSNFTCIECSGELRRFGVIANRHWRTSRYVYLSPKTAPARSFGVTLSFTGFTSHNDASVRSVIRILSPAESFSLRIRTTPKRANLPLRSMPYNFTILFIVGLCSSLHALCGSV